jgi:hypothetical protein
VDTCKSGDIRGVEAAAVLFLFWANLAFGLKAFGEEFVGAWVGRGDYLSSMGVLVPASGSVSQPGGAFERCQAPRLSGEASGPGWFRVQGELSFGSQASRMNWLKS